MSPPYIRKSSDTSSEPMLSLGVHQYLTAVVLHIHGVAAGDRKLAAQRTPAIEHALYACKARVSGKGATGEGSSGLRCAQDHDKLHPHTRRETSKLCPLENRKVPLPWNQLSSHSPS